MRKWSIVAAILAGLTLFGESHGQKNKDYYKDIRDAMGYFKSNKATDKSFALATFGLVGLEAKKSGDQKLAQFLAQTSTKATVEGLVTTDPAIRQAANQAIGSVNPAIAAPVLSLVNGKDYDQRLQGMKDLANLGPGAVGAVPALMAFLKDAKPEDKAAVVQSIATVGSKDPQVAELLAGMALKDPDPAVQRAALASLSKMPNGGDAVAMLLGVLNTERDPKLRLAAIQGLGAAGKGNPAAMQELERLTKDPDPNIQAQARAALEKLQAPK